MNFTKWLKIQPENCQKLVDGYQKQLIQKIWSHFHIFIEQNFMKVF